MTKIQNKISEKKLSQKTATVILWLLFAVSVILFIATFTNFNDLWKKPLVRDETPKQADAIIVLGGGVVTDTRTLPWSVEERVRKGVELYQDGYAQNIIVTGGLVKGFSYAESEVMSPYARFLGVAKENIFEESRSEDTRGNAVYSWEIMRQHAWENAIIVTSDYHSQRACHVFRKLNMAVTCVAAFKNPSWQGQAFRNLMDAKAIAREYLATVYYWMRGYI